MNWTVQLRCSTRAFQTELSHYYTSNPFVLSIFNNRVAFPERTFPSSTDTISPGYSGPLTLGNAGGLARYSPSLASLKVITHYHKRVATSYFQTSQCLNKIKKFRVLFNCMDESVTVCHSLYMIRHLYLKNTYRGLHMYFTQGNPFREQQGIPAIIRSPEYNNYQLTIC